MPKQIFLLVSLLMCCIAGALCAQMPRGVWWDGKIAQDINLTDAQLKQIKSIQKDFHGRLSDLRAAVNKSENDVETAFNDDPVDLHKANEAIDRLAGARAEMFRATSQFELKLRNVLTAEQWQDLKKRFPMRGPGIPPPDGRPGGPWRRGPGGPGGSPSGKGTTATTGQSQ